MLSAADRGNACSANANPISSSLAGGMGDPGTEYGGFSASTCVSDKEYMGLISSSSIRSARMRGPCVEKGEPM